jgi:type I restriction enzyme S subunit
MKKINNSKSQRQETRLGDLIQVTHGIYLSSSYYSDGPTASILLTPGNFKIGGGFDGSNIKYYDAARDPVPKKYIIEPGEIIIALTDLSSEYNILGCPAKIPDSGFYAAKLNPSHPMDYLHNQRIGRVLPRSEKITGDYLYWLLRSGDYRNYIIATASGATVKHTSPRRILAYRFLLPPLADQTAAVGILTAVETKILILEHIDEMLERMVMCIFQYWFTPYRQQPSKPLSAFGKIVCGKTPSKKEHNYFGGPLPFIKIPDLRGQVYITHTGDSLSSEGAATQPSKQIPPNSICVSCIAVIGLTALTSAWCHTNQQINSIIPHHHWNRYYLYCYLKTIGPELEALSAGGTMTLNINTRLFSRLQIPGAPQAMLEKFYQAVHPIFNRILLNIRCKERLIKLRDTLLPRLLTGKIKIRAGKVSK